MIKKLVSIVLSVIFSVVIWQVYFTHSKEGSYPAKPVTLIVHSKPGSGVDLMARKVAEIAGKDFGVTMVVKNKTGTQGMKAMQYVLDSDKDGYTILAVARSFLSTVLLNNSQNGMNNFAFFAYMIKDAEALITNVNSDIVTAEDILNKKTEQVWIGPGAGGRDHLMTIKTADVTGLNVKYRAYKSGPTSLLAMMRQEGDVYVGNPMDTRGKPDLKVAIIAGPERLVDFPDVPTFRELGFDLEEYMWRGFAFAKGVEQSRIDFMENLFRKISLTEEWKQYQKEIFAYPEFKGYKDFTKVVKSQSRETELYLKEAGILQNYLKESNMPLALVFIIIFLVVKLIWLFIKRAKGLRVTQEDHVYLLLMTFALFVIYQTTLFIIPDSVDVSSPWLVPVLWSLLLIVFLNVNFFRMLKEQDEFVSGDVKTVLIVLSGMILYLTGVKFIGYYFSSLLFIPFVMYLLKCRNIITILNTTLAYNIICYFVFVKLLSIGVPVGELF